MKWLILLGLIVVVGALVALRYRRQIQMALYVWRMFRKMRQVGKANEKQIETAPSGKEAALVRCAKCGTWTPAERSLKLGARTNYCSAACLETAASAN